MKVGEMTSKTIVSGKHPIVVRIGEEDYRDLRLLAAEKNLSVNEMIARGAVEMAREFRREKEPL